MTDPDSPPPLIPPPVPPPKPRGGPMSALRTYFLTGIIVVAPLAITAYVVWAFVDFVDRLVTPLLPAVYNPRTYLPFDVPGVGVVVAAFSLTMIGFLAANLLGRTLVRAGERVLARMPVVSSIYSALKQVFETLLGSRAQSFRQVALVEFPRRGGYSLAFVTSEGVNEVSRKLGETDLLTLYVPTALNPTSGYMIFLPRREVILLDMTVEEGMKLVISGGVVQPGKPVPH
ncbi:DUF502 domain-containing protein [Desertibaculum subflavum]|uniref:DUF502 domain-containing protein n=1 Tax=Desertibaculum subflavum TaxID=2268458 RepID=UPI0034D1F6C7